MCLLFETIRVEKGIPQNIRLHQERVTKSRKAIFSVSDPLDITSLQVPEQCTDGIFKCRVIYGERVQSVEFIPYSKKIIRKVKLVETNNIDYCHKYYDRAVFSELLNSFPDFDDIIIVKNGLLTDSSFSNLAFLKNGQWYTPREPLLEGIRIRQLLNAGKVIEASISASNIQNFEKVSFINAMLDIEESVVNIEGIE